MLSIVRSGGVRGLASYLMQVEVDAANGLPSFVMVGYVSSDTKEACERVRVALKNAGYRIPPMHITVNLSPAAIRKEGVSIDLPLAIGLLVSMGEIPEEKLDRVLILGELGLDGKVMKVSGTLPIVTAAKAAGITTCILPAENATEGAVVGGIRIVGVSSLQETIAWILSEESVRNELIPPTTVDLNKLFARANEICTEDFSEISGQQAVKRAAEVAAAGFHHLLIIGPPGAGKSMIAKRIPGILPPLSEDESLEVSAIYSVSGLLGRDEALITRRPFMSPHHTVTEAALTGGGSIPRPGIISLAHRGVLFLDELPEFSRTTLDLLRQPLEDRKIRLARTHGSCTFPADFQLIAAMNPCPCGYYPDRNKCRCTDSEIRRYLSRVSGPILDRLDICIEAKRIDVSELSQAKKNENESSADIRRRVLAARDMQQKRFMGTKLRFNSDMGPSDIKRYCPLGSKEEAMLSRLFHTLDLSARSYHRIIKVARTIADLEGAPVIETKHLSEAACYRMTDARYWSNKEGD
ncbi:MAG: YifB family Mg chelatase-like AAA ATPase [Lachnospiraceae bacterium]|nr:YifB family Mg chelatase-like AAA ATPase [Lachnospiraceae bacterium]